MGRENHILLRWKSPAGMPIICVFPGQGRFGGAAHTGPGRRFFPKEGSSVTKDLTVGSPAKLILGFALPTLFGLLFQQMYNMVDAMIVGRLLGSGALAAVGATGSISFLIIGFCTGVCSGFAIPVAREMGAGEHGRMRRYVANSAYLSVIFALVMTVATGLACRGILTAMDTPEDIFSDAYRYIFIIFMGIPATYLYNLLAGIIRSLGDSRTPVYFLALSSVLNIALDLALILWCGLGVAGAAVATVASQTVSGLACLWYVYRRFPILRLSRAERRADKKLCRDLCVMGVPMGLQFSVTAVGSIILQSAVNGLGSLYVAAAAAGAKIQNLLFSPLDALGAAMATYCGQNVGAAQLDRLGRGVRACVLMGFVYSAGAFAAMQAFAPSCALWFIDPGAAGTSALVALVSRYLRVSTTFFTTLALVVILRMSIQGMGYSVLAIVSGGMEMAARMGMAGLLVPTFGFEAVCFASPVAWICADLFLIPACVCCIRRLRRHQERFRQQQARQTRESVHVHSRARWYADPVQLHRHRVPHSAGSVQRRPHRRIA